MAEDNVARARAGFQAFLDGDVQAALAFIDEKVVYRPVEEGGLIHGRDGYFKQLVRWLEAWDVHEVEPLEFVPVGSDKVVISLRFVGRGKGSGVEVTALWWHVYTLQEGRAVRIEEFTTSDEAFAAAGVHETG